jgi:DNA-binding NarL/FixJ family response regulator
MRIALVDDHAFIRSAVRQALSAPDIVVVAEIATAEDALNTLPDLAPDLVLLDVDLPAMNGIQLLRELRPRLPDTAFVMLTVSADPADVLEAMRLGAAGYLTKDLDGAALQRAVRGTRSGDLAMPRRLAARAIRDLVAGSAARAERSAPGVDALSRREHEILRFMAQGLTDRQIGQALTISTRTVESHVSNILRKLHARNRAEAAQRYVESG